MLGDMLALLRPERLEALPDLVVERRVHLPPIVPAMREPEIENGPDLILVHRSSQSGMRVCTRTGRPSMLLRAPGDLGEPRRRILRP